MDYVSEYLAEEISIEAAEKFIWLFDRIELGGDNAFRELLLSKSIKKIRGENKIYEFRVNKESSYRVIFAKVGSRLICGHGFIKKSRNTPKKEIETAIKRLKPFL